MKATGERFVPGKMFKHSEIEHMHRYSILQNVLKDKVVLDAACGTGYGSNMIASVANFVYGIDISQEAVDFANDNFGKRGNLEYRKGDITSIPFEDNMFDVVVSFETIEHVNEAMQISFLKEIKRVLKPDGVLIMSTPNKEIYTVLAGNVATEWHVKEFFEDEFDSFLRKEFSNIRYYQQYISKASYLLDGREKEACLSGLDAGKKGKFIVAVAGNAEIEEWLNLNSVYYYPDEYVALDEICQIYNYDEESGFLEEGSEIIEISSKGKNINLQIDIEESKMIKKLRIDPLQNSCAIENFEIQALTASNEWVKPVTVIDNADEIIEDVHYFYHRDCQYIVEFPEETVFSKYLINFIIRKYNIDSYQFALDKISYYEDLLQRERESFAVERKAFEHEQGKFVSELEQMNREREDMNREREDMNREREDMNREREDMNREREDIIREKKIFYNRTLKQRVADVFKNPGNKEDTNIK